MAQKEQFGGPAGAQINGDMRKSLAVTGVV